MSETVVPYGRFVEVRQRRQRVAADLALRPRPLPNDSHDRELATIDGEAVAEKPLATPTQTAVALPQTLL
jgi:hypothetical protein